MEELLTIQELSKILKISPKTIYRLVHEDSIPHLKIGGSIRFNQRQIEVWLQRKSRKRRRIEID
ncbi:MAG: helix-turn-helix domain-containing protein [bacterium]